MPLTGLWVRVFLGLLIAVLTPALILIAGPVIGPALLWSLPPSLVAVLIVVGIVVWAAVLAIVAERMLADEIRSLVELALRGGPSQDRKAGDAHEAMALALEERNRQIATLAREAHQLPISETPLKVVAALLGAVRGVMGDPTWRLAVVRSAHPELLPPGVYDDVVDGVAVRESVGDLEQWAAGACADAPVAVQDGPWGAFSIVQIAAGEMLGAMLIAPWEGRPAPSPGELDFLSLVGQQSGTSLEHSLLYARVRHQADELNRLAAIQTDFLRGVTHDLQTPLTSIGALAAELRANPVLPASANGDLETIAHQADRLRRMVAQLLVASRVEAGAVTPQHDVFAVRPVLERTWSALRADRPFSFQVEDPPYLAVADPDRFEQVLWAVLDNAVKYSPPGSPIAVEVRPRASSLAVHVRDRGAGMDDRTRDQAFDQFYRSDAARRLAPDGSGVGLYAARGLMLAMGGSIEVESTLGAGTEVVLTLPAERSDDID